MGLSCVCFNLLAASNGDLANSFYPASESSILAIKRKFDENGVHEIICDSLLDSVPLAVEKVFARRFRVLAIGVDHLQSFSAPLLLSFSFKIISICMRLPRNPSPQVALLRT